MRVELPLFKKRGEIASNATSEVPLTAQEKAPVVVSTVQPPIPIANNQVPIVPSSRTKAYCICICIVGIALSILGAIGYLVYTQSK